MADAFSEPPIRFLAFGIAFGEAVYNEFRDMRDYLDIVGGLFILAHMASKILSAGNGQAMAMGAMDALIFHLIASLAVPVVVTRFVLRMSANFIRELRLGRAIVRYAPMVLTMCVVVLMSVPVDNIVNKLLDETVRKMSK
ncbi:unnamed protein product [Lymnaea stagnalis]|uniref:Mitochondrial fission process protein 1 n=1 Tax=Lymnaea stagnalis TaxID=6523 RepID=A0AAV2ILE1_LYMST